MSVVRTGCFKSHLLSFFIPVYCYSYGEWEPGNQLHNWRSYFTFTIAYPDHQQMLQKEQDEIATERNEPLLEVRDC